MLTPPRTSTAPAAAASAEDERRSEAAPAPVLTPALAGRREVGVEAGEDVFEEVVGAGGGRRCTAISCSLGVSAGGGGGAVAEDTVRGRYSGTRAGLTVAGAEVGTTLGAVVRGGER